MLAHSWETSLNRWFFRDVVVNVALYVPFGTAACLAFRQSLYLPVLLGFGLSLSMETLQIFEIGRNSSAIDVITNVIGTVAGVALGLVFERMAGPERLSPGSMLAGMKVRDRSALMLLFLWAAFFLFPFFPMLGLYIPMQRLRVFWHSAFLEPVPLISGTVMWLAAGELMRAAGVVRARRWLAFAAIVLPIQFFIVDRQPLPAELAGAIAGVLFFSVGGLKIRSIAAAFLLVVLVRGLSPFHFSSTAGPFMWLPFSGSLRSEWQPGMLVLIEKSFYYGTAVWLLRACGINLKYAAAILAVFLAGIEVAQIHIAGRTAEITDPALSIVLSGTIGILSRQTYPRVSR